MVKTQDDIRKVKEIIDDLERLGVPPDVILNLRVWLDKQAKRIRSQASTRRQQRHQGQSATP